MNLSKKNLHQFKLNQTVHKNIILEKLINGLRKKITKRGPSFIEPIFVLLSSLTSREVLHHIETGVHRKLLLLECLGRRPSLNEIRELVTSHVRTRSSLWFSISLKCRFEYFSLLKYFIFRPIRYEFTKSLDFTLKSLSLNRFQKDCYYGQLF